MSRKALLPSLALVEGELVAGRAVVIEGATIADVVAVDVLPADMAVVDLSGMTLLPGFIDTQVNGGGGVLLNDEPTLAGLRAVGAAHRRFGTTGFMATVISDHLDVVDRAMRAVEQGVAQGLPGLLGLHVEGPFLHAARRGIHAADRIRRFDDAAFDLLTGLRAGVMMVTLAPDEVSCEDIARLTRAGVIVSLGHSDASYEQTHAALAAGASGVTHLFNAMSGLTSRAPGMVGAVLENRQAWCGLIVDGRHVHPASLRVALAARPADRFMLVTDAMPPVGTDARSFELQGKVIRADAFSCFDDQGTLAGSMLDMATCVRNAMDMMGLDLAAAAGLASTSPAAFLGQEDRRGLIRKGHVADLVAWDAHGRVRASWIAGVMGEACFAG